jgi:hypothetical protein
MPYGLVFRTRSEVIGLANEAGFGGTDDRSLSSATWQGRKSGAYAGPGVRGSDPPRAVFDGIARGVEAQRRQAAKNDGLPHGSSGAGIVVKKSFSFQPFVPPLPELKAGS